MRRIHVNLNFGFCVNPTIFNPATRKGERMAAILIDNSQMQPTVRRYGID